MLNRLPALAVLIFVVTTRVAVAESATQTCSSPPGFSLTYPTTLNLCTDQQVLSQVLKVGLDMLKVTEEGKAAIAQVGPQLFLSVYPMGTPRMNPNLVLITENAKAAGVTDSLGYCKLALVGAQKMVPGMEVVEQPRGVPINGRDFATYVSRLTVGQDVKVRQVFYCYLEPVEMLAYAFGITTGEDELDQIPVFEQVIRTVTFGKVSASR